MKSEPDHLTSMRLLKSLSLLNPCQLDLWFSLHLLYLPCKYNWTFHIVSSIVILVSYCIDIFVVCVVSCIDVWLVAVLPVFSVWRFSYFKARSLLYANVRLSLFRISILIIGMSPAVMSRIDTWFNVPAATCVLLWICKASLVSCGNTSSIVLRAFEKYWITVSFSICLMSGILCTAEQMPFWHCPIQLWQSLEL